MKLKLVPPTPAHRCRFKLAHQQGRGGNRRAIYVCQSHFYPNACLPLVTRGWTNRK